MFILELCSRNKHYCFTGNQNNHTKPNMSGEQYWDYAVTKTTIARIFLLMQKNCKNTARILHPNQKLFKNGETCQFPRVQKQLQFDIIAWILVFVFVFVCINKEMVHFWSITILIFTHQLPNTSYRSVCFSNIIMNHEVSQLELNNSVTIRWCNCKTINSNLSVLLMKSIQK